MLTFQKIIDFARSNKKEIVDRIKDTVEWYEDEDICISVIVAISENLDTNGNHYLILSVDNELDNIGLPQSVHLFSVFVEHKYSRKKILKIVEQELTAFENSINSFDN